METKSYVYKVERNSTGKSYIGVSSKPYRRLAQHQQNKTELGEDLREHGLHAFTFSIIFEGDTLHCLDLEPNFIRSHNATYNIRHAGNEPMTRDDPTAVMARAARRGTGLTQASFAARFNLGLSSVRDWEQGRVTPDRATVNLLGMIRADHELAALLVRKAFPDG